LVLQSKKIPARSGTKFQNAGNSAKVFDQGALDAVDVLTAYIVRSPSQPVISHVQLGSRSIPDQTQKLF
jgi:hypothetical protein